MQVDIREIKPFDIVGYASRHRLPGVRNISDIPVFWEKINLAYEAALSTLHHDYTDAPHSEVAVCFDIDDAHDCFTYLIGVGVTEQEAARARRPGTHLISIEGGLYAVFTTPPTKEPDYARAVQDIWRRVFQDWLPNSEYEYDTSRTDYEYYDERDHESAAQMDVCIPIRKRDGQA